MNARCMQDYYHAMGGIEEMRAQIQFPKLEPPPTDFLHQMEEYCREAPRPIYPGPSPGLSVQSQAGQSGQPAQPTTQQQSGKKVPLKPLIPMHTLCLLREVPRPIYPGPSPGLSVQSQAGQSGQPAQPTMQQQSGKKVNPAFLASRLVIYSPAGKSPRSQGRPASPASQLLSSRAPKRCPPKPLNPVHTLCLLRKALQPIYSEPSPGLSVQSPGDQSGQPGQPTTQQQSGKKMGPSISYP